MDSPPKQRLVGIVVLSWLVVIGIDFLLHASVLAPIYARPSSFLLPPERAFSLIPLGYLSFLIYVIMIVWLMSKLDIHTWNGGIVFGLKMGLLWGAQVIGLLSITTAPPILMLGWFIGQSLESGIAGLVAGAGFGADNLRKLMVGAVLFIIGSIVIGVVIQNI